MSTTISGEFPRGDTDGEELWLAESWGGGITYWYKYEWVADKDPEVESGGSSEEEEETAAPTPEPQYHWELVSQEPRKEEYQLHAPAGTGRSHEEDGDRGFEWEWANNGTTFEYVYRCLYNHTNDYEAAFHDKEGCAGEFAIYRIAVDGLKTEYAPGGTITLCLSVDAEKSEYLCPLMYSQLGTYLTGKNPDEEYPIRMDGRETTLVDKYGESWLYFIFDHADMENTRRESIVWAQFPEEAEVGDVVYLAIDTQTHDIQLYSGYKFVYKEGAPAGAGTVRPGGEDRENWIVDTNAWKTPGEDEGISIPAKIVIGVGGTAAAAAGVAGAVGSSNGGETDERKRKSSYKMYVYKDFGDSIRKGAPIVGVFARIAEITADGQEFDRSDLTAQIQLSSGTPGLTVTPVGVMNSYMGAEVSVPNEGVDLSEGVVSASYSGAGGVFTQNIHFRVIGRPYVQFPEKPENEMTLQKAMLVGDTTPLEILLNAEDFAEEPDSVTFKLLADDIDANSVIDVSSVRIERFRYQIRLTSRITPDPAHPSPYRISVWVKAANPKEMAEDVFKLLVCPEGISVISPPLNEQKQLVINTEDADPGPGVKIKPTDLQLVCAYRDGTGQVVWDTVNFALGKLAPTDAVTTHVLAGFEYEVNTQQENEGRYYINPKTVLPVDPSKPYIVKLPVSYPRNAPRISTEIPVRLDGEPIDQTELFQREKEWELLKRDCQRYGLGTGGKAQQLMRQTKHGIASASDLRLIRRQILEEAREYYEQEATEMTELDEKLARCEMVFSVSKWLGDQAQSFLIKYTVSKIPGGSNYADLVELIIVPVKDAAVTAYGQCLANDYWGTGESASEVYKENFIKALTTFGDNAFMGTITNVVSGGSGFLGRDYGESPLTKKQIAGLIVGYYTYLTVVHYTTGEEEKGDVWLSMWCGLKDLSFNSFKTFVCSKLGEFVTKSDNDDGVGSIYDNCVQTVFRWITVDTNGAGAFKRQLANVIGTYAHFFKGSDGLRADAGQQAVDMFMDVFLNSTVANIKAMFSGDKFIIQIGDAELQIFSTQWMLILVELLWEMIKTVFGTVVLKPLWDIIDYGKYLSGGSEDVKTLPYTPDEERKAINSQYKSGGSENR